MNSISLVISVMNRTDRVIQCLESWINSNVINDIILTDWSSREPILSDREISNFCHQYKSIKILRINNQKYFSLSKSYNYAIDHTKNDSILKIDIDHILVSPKFPLMLQQLSKQLKTDFYCCEHTTLEHWGICFFSKEAFFEIGKYNERLNGWGYDDQDLYKRLSKIRKKNIIRNIPYLVYHNPHGDDLRVANYQIKDKFESNKLNEIIANGDI